MDFLKWYIPLILLCISPFIIYGITWYFNKRKKEKQKEEELRIKEIRKNLITNVFNFLEIDLNKNASLFSSNKNIVVKSRVALEKYNLISFFKENRNFDYIKSVIKDKEENIKKMQNFIETDTSFTNEEEYSYLILYMQNFINKKAYFEVEIQYISSANNLLGKKHLFIDNKTLKNIEENPELYMPKSEIKDNEKEILENKRKETYKKIDLIINLANKTKDRLIIKDLEAKLDNLIFKLLNQTFSIVQKSKYIYEFDTIDRIIKETSNSINEIYKLNENLISYYHSDDFLKIKNACSNLIESQKDFNTYIEEKITNIYKLFGTRVVRNETINEDAYEYIRPYKKTITPFSVDVSSTVFASAENNPIQYVIKYFYPDKTLYKEHINNLKQLLLELENLKEAKEVIENYKKEYKNYLQSVPSFVIEHDERGFYQKLGFTIIDEKIFSVEYKFSYTSDGGFAQRYFTIPMNEETIIKIINCLENKLSLSSLAKEQRQLMTPKLRNLIKTRDNFTCCSCGNSTYKEPNLLLEIDHVIPIAKGGLTTEDNLQTLCWKCNRAKGTKVNNNI